MRWVGLQDRVNQSWCGCGLLGLEILGFWGWGLGGIFLRLVLVLELPHWKSAGTDSSVAAIGRCSRGGWAILWRIVGEDQRKGVVVFGRFGGLISVLRWLSNGFIQGPAAVLAMAMDFTAFSSTRCRQGEYGLTVPDDYQAILAECALTERV